MTALSTLPNDDRGMSVVEFGLLAPMFVWASMTGLELTNMVLARQKVERLAASSADLFARNKVQPNESQVHDVFKAIALIAAPFDAKTYGRVIVTGVIGTADGATNVVGNKIAWQRCSGSLAGQTSSIGAEWKTTPKYEDSPDVTLPNTIKLGAAQMVIVAEVAYKYEPLIKTGLVPGMASSDIIREKAIYIVRASPFTSITPISGVTPAGC